MNIHELREAQTRYLKRIDEVSKKRVHLHAIRSAFAKHFDAGKIRNMTIDEYVIGKPAQNGHFNFCYTLERELDGLGRIIGANAFKFGVYYGRTKSDDRNQYRFAKKFGNTAREAFESVRNNLLSLLDAGFHKDIGGVAANPLSPMFKGKILCAYFPDDYLNVFSPEHLNYFLTQLDLDTEELARADAAYKRAELLNFKHADAIMRIWSADLFADFLYTEYPGRPPRYHVSQLPKILREYENPEFPLNPKPIFINLDIQPAKPKPKDSAKGRLAAKPDYEKEARKNRKLGDRGEKIVMDLEYERLSQAGRIDLAKRIERVSVKSDSHGYDILSFESDGKKRYIEVKATVSRAGNANFFLTANELKTAQTVRNFYLYLVFEVTSTSPKVWPIGNPLNPIADEIQMVPVNYKVTINASKSTIKQLPEHRLKKVLK